MRKEEILCARQITSQQLHMVHGLVLQMISNYEEVAISKDMDTTKQEKQRMEKCNYCVDSSPYGKCRWASESIRAEHCAVAVQNMIRCLGGMQGGSHKRRST